MTQDNNDILEQSLMKAAQDKTLHYAFYSDFSDAQVYALLMSELPEGKSVVKKDTAIQLLELDFEGKPYVPVFSSPEKLREFVKKECRYISVKGRDMVSMVQERELFLNPGSHYSKIITRKEMGYMKNGAPTSVDENNGKPGLLTKLFGGRK